MTNPIVFSIDGEGDVRFLVNEDTSSFLDATSAVRRASHVLPSIPLLRALFVRIRLIFGEHGRMAEFTRRWNCSWVVDLSPVNGPKLLTIFKSRQAAIDYEIQWLNTNFL
jgi:hypothetical protein